MLQHRHPAFGGDAVDQRTPAARHHQIDAIDQIQQRADCGAIHGRHQLNAIRRQALGRDRPAQAGNDCRRRSGAFRTAAQDHGIAGFQAQSASIGGDVRPRFVDHCDAADRYPYAADLQTVRALPVFDDLADRIRQGDDLVEAPGHAFDPLRRQQQPVDEGGIAAFGSGRGDVFGVGSDDHCLLGPQQSRRVLQRCVLARAIGAAKNCGRRTSAPAHVLDQGRDVAGNRSLYVHDFMPRRGSFHDQIIAVDDLVAATEAQNFLDLDTATTGDATCILGP